MFSESLQGGRNLLRNIQITHDEVDHVGEVMQAAKTRRSILRNLDDSVDTLSNCVGQRAFDIGEDVRAVPSQRVDEVSHGRQPAFEGGRHPAFEEGRGAANVRVVPEVFEFVLQNPGTVDTAVAASELVDGTRVALRARGGTHAQQPTQSFDGFTVLGTQSPPLLLADLIHRFIELLDEVEAIDDEFCVGANAP